MNLIKKKNRFSIVCYVRSNFFSSIDFLKRGFMENKKKISFFSLKKKNNSKKNFEINSQFSLIFNNRNYLVESGNLNTFKNYKMNIRIPYTKL